MSAQGDVRDALGLVARYCLLWDDRRYDEWVELFAAEATFDWRGRIATGRPAIQSMIGAGNHQRPPGPGVHIMSNTVVVVDPDVRATSDFLYVAGHAGRHEILYAGRTYDRFVRTPDGLRFAARAVRFLGDEAPAGWAL